MTDSKPVDVVHSRIGQRGTFVIPALLRRRLGLGNGTPVVVEEREGGLFIRPAAAEVPTELERKEMLQSAREAYAALRADPEAWADEKAERAAWQGLAGETLPAEPWSDQDFASRE